VIGQTLAHYRITAAIGAGAMGEVYRATDAKLGRDVAIKVLPREVAQDPERLGRFKREAHLLASLNHPNIAAIYGLEEAEGKPFLALELVEGEDLKHRHARGAIPVDEALEIAEQIAEGLEEAHAKGIVHRDLKPANVKLTSEGRVKVLDFGLAKAWEGDTGAAGSSVDLSQSPTLTRTGTLAGVILGTAAYMAPEQASGKSVDKRADIWSFGVVLFEMLTGQSLFSGETASEVMAAVIREEPAWDRLPAGCPPPITRLLHRCLRKRPPERLQDIGDARLEIQDARAGTADEGGRSSASLDEVRRERRLRERSVWATTLVVTAGLASFFAYRQLTQAPAPRPAVHIVLDAPKDLSAPDWGAPVVSPDGSRVVFAASASDGRARLWTRALAAPGVRPLAGTEGASSPFWSPDGRSLAFFAEGEVRNLSLATGTVQTIGTLPQASTVGGSWGQDGTLLFSTGGAGARIYAVPAGGGEVRPLTTHDTSRGEIGHWWPQFLPDGRRFLFVVGSSGEDTGLYIASLDQPDERRRIQPGLARTLYAAPGYLLFVRDGTLLAQPFDVARAQLTGEPATVAQSVAAWTVNPGWGWFSASASGTLAYLEGQATRGVELTWFDRKGTRLGTVGKPRPYGQIALSPDGKRVAAELAEGGASDIWTIDVARGVATRQTFDAASNRDPVWSPDGREVAFRSSREGSPRLYRKAVQGNAPASPLGRGLSNVYSESWSAPAKGILYVTGSENSHAFGMVPSDGHAEPVTILKTKFWIDEPQISPDGRWLAYDSLESGQWEVYVEPFRREGERVRVSTEGGGQPRWRGDGRELFYVAPNGRLMAVDVRAKGDRIDVGLPAALFSGVNPDPTEDHYAATADGQRFLVPVPVGEDAGMRIHVVTDWTSLLK
jgi:Tol biopolymer transport system component/tRNA A-37 threonylcarbamoyl transferase component Bud32